MSEKNIYTAPHLAEVISGIDMMCELQHTSIKAVVNGSSNTADLTAITHL